MLLSAAIARLRAIPHGSLDEFRADDRNVDAALRRLQVAIQVLIDVGSHLVSRLGLGAPESSQDLGQAGDAPSHDSRGSHARSIDVRHTVPAGADWSGGQLAWLPAQTSAGSQPPEEALHATPPKNVCTHSTVVPAQ